MSGYTNTLPRITHLSEQRPLSDVRAEAEQLLLQGPYAATRKLADEVARAYDLTLSMPSVPADQEACAKLSPGGSLRCSLEPHHDFKNGSRHAARDVAGNTFFTWVSPDWVEDTAPTGEHFCGKYLQSETYCGLHQPAALVMARAAEDAANLKLQDRQGGYVAYAYETDHKVCLAVVDQATAAAGIADMDVWVQRIELERTEHMMDVVDSLEVTRVLEHKGWTLAPVAWDLVVLGNRTSHGYRIPLVPVQQPAAEQHRAVMTFWADHDHYVGVSVWKVENTDDREYGTVPDYALSTSCTIENGASITQAQAAADTLLNANSTLASWERTGPWVEIGERSAAMQERRFGAFVRRTN